MKNVFHFISLTSLLFSFGCATQYSKVGFTGGYSEIQRSRNEFTVAFSGNGYTSGKRAVDLCLLRCAELTVGHGYRYFLITDRRSEMDNSTSVTTGNYIPTGYGGGIYFATTQTILKPSTANNILCLRNKPDSTSEYYDAQVIIDELSKKYGVKREIERYPVFCLRKAALGIRLEHISQKNQDNIQAIKSTSSKSESPRFKIRGFTEESLAQLAGIKIGDTILSVDGTIISSIEVLDNKLASCNIGDTVQVSVRRGNKDIQVPVKTVFNAILAFKTVSDIKCDSITSETDVRIYEGSLGMTTAFPIAMFGDWENPSETIDEFKSYAIQAAISKGANCIQLLTSSQKIKDVHPTADSKLSFLCSLMAMPKARLGVAFETGTGFENRRIIRRIQNEDAEKAGLRIGDNILEINGIDITQNMSLAAKEQMKWEIGQTLQITIARDGKESKMLIKSCANK